jgi:hypothetical protein
MQILDDKLYIKLGMYMRTDVILKASLPYLNKEDIDYETWKSDDFRSSFLEVEPLSPQLIKHNDIDIRIKLDVSYINKKYGNLKMLNISTRDNDLKHAHLCKKSMKILYELYKHIRHDYFIIIVDCYIKLHRRSYHWTLEI